VEKKPETAFPGSKPVYTKWFSVSSQSRTSASQWLLLFRFSLFLRFGSFSGVCYSRIPSVHKCLENILLLTPYSWNDHVKNTPSRFYTCPACTVFPHCLSSPTGLFYYKEQTVITEA